MVVPGNKMNTMGVWSGRTPEESNPLQLWFIPVFVQSNGRLYGLCRQVVAGRGVWFYLNRKYMSCVITRHST